VTPPSSLPSDGDTIVRALKRLYNIGIHPDWWCLETMPVQTWHNVDDLIAARDPRCRGVLVVDGDDGGGAWTGAPGGDRFPSNHARISAAAVSRSCCGFFVGLTVLRAPSSAWLAGTIDDDTLIARVRAVFEARVDAWQRVRRAEAT
jgi:5-dehydro-2-deoxygluconokinase